MRKYRYRIVWAGVLLLFLVASVLAYLRGQRRWVVDPEQAGPISLSLVKVTGVRSTTRFVSVPPERAPADHEARDQARCFLYCDVVVDNGTAHVLNSNGAWAYEGKFRLVLSRAGKVVAEAPIHYHSITAFYRLGPGQRPAQLVAEVEIPPEDQSDLDARIVGTLPEGQGQDTLDSNPCPVQWPGPIEGEVGLKLITASLSAGADHPEVTIHCEVDFNNRTGEDISTTYYSWRLDGFLLELWRGDKRVSSQYVGTLSSNSSLGSHRLPAGRSREQFVFSLDGPPGGWAGLEARIVGSLPNSRYHKILESNRLPLQLASQ